MRARETIAESGDEDEDENFEIEDRLGHGSECDSDGEQD